MKQLSFFDEPTLPTVNVASVPHRSPFRYPGGKTWLVPSIRRWLKHFPAKPSEFVEPFAGGAISGLTVAFEHLAHHVTLIELDKHVSAVWQSVIQEGYGPSIANRILHFELTDVCVKELLETPTDTLEETAFQTIIRNRVNRGGILASGAGRMKSGENGRGLASRWYPQTLHKRLIEIHAIRERLSFFNLDAMQYLFDHKDDPDVVWFIDPPYTLGSKKPGSRLYDHSELDHEALFEIAYQLKGDFLMTYDNQLHVRSLAARHNFDTEVVSMKNTHHAKQTELLIGRNLNWLRN